MKKILLVDANPLMLTVLADCYEIGSVEIDLACSGADAIRMLKENRYDSVIVDARIQPVGGVEMTDHVRLANETCEILLRNGSTTYRV